MVSPYLNLALPTGDAGFNYATLVQPQLQQMRYNQQQTVQTQVLNRELQQQQQGTITPYGPIGGMRPTGGSMATRGNYSHYYPSKGQSMSGGRQRRYQTGIGGAGGSAMGGLGSYVGMRGLGMGGLGMGGLGMGGGFYQKPALPDVGDPTQPARRCIVVY
jgi:hypothetical protein